MRTRSANRLATGGTALVLVATLLSACSLEPVMIGQWYTLNTPPTGACPSFRWQFEVDPERSIGGNLSTEAQQRIANLSGQLAPDDSFQITATGVAGHRTANLTGRFTSLVSTVSIHGDVLGSGCDGQTIRMRTGRYFSIPGVGFGGGGGGN